MAIALGCFGGGSMAAALLLPHILDRLPDRRVMLPAAVFLALVQLALAVLFLGTAWFGAQTYTTAAAGLAWPALLIGWGLLGVGYSAIMTPTGRLLRRSAQPPTGRRSSPRNSRCRMPAGC